MRAYQLTDFYKRDLPYGSQNAPLERMDKQRWLLELDEYEVVNLKRLLDAVAGHTKEWEVPISAFNNGDWVGQIGFYLPETTGKIKPNKPYPDELSK